MYVWLQVNQGFNSSLVKHKAANTFPFAASPPGGLRDLAFEELAYSVQMFFCESTDCMRSVTHDKKNCSSQLVLKAPAAPCIYVYILKNRHSDWLQCVKMC